MCKDKMSGSSLGENLLSRTFDERHAAIWYSIEYLTFLSVCHMSQLQDCVHQHQCCPCYFRMVCYYWTLYSHSLVVPTVCFLVLAQKYMPHLASWVYTPAHHAVFYMDCDPSGVGEWSKRDNYFTLHTEEMGRGKLKGCQRKITLFWIVSTEFACSAKGH